VRNNQELLGTAKRRLWGRLGRRTQARTRCAAVGEREREREGERERERERERGAHQVPAVPALPACPVAARCACYGT